jgi:hypothetical protein
LRHSRQVVNKNEAVKTGVGEVMVFLRLDKTFTRWPAGASLLFGVNDTLLRQIVYHKAGNPSLRIRHGTGIGCSALRTPDHSTAVSD